jgi:DNA (cytosine-5)-methyltransferase 1
LLVEIDKNAAATMRLNRPNWNIINGDIKDVSFKEYQEKIDVLAGGFPCQAFSYAGKGLGFGEPRGTLFFEFLRATNEIRPKVVLGENVRGLIQHDSGRTLKTMVHCLEEAGYTVFHHLVRAQFLDVPQKRERLIILGVRKDLKLKHMFLLLTQLMHFYDILFEFLLLYYILY